MAETNVRDLFANDPQRFQTLSLREGPLLVDVSKQRVTTETLRLLLDLAKACDLESARAAMFAGEKINVTESRAVLHVALRHRGDTPIAVDGHDVMPGVRATLARLKAFTEQVRSGAWTGGTGK
ncbi:MAG: glucose-6-phosphate isomerase, partial [Rhodobacteraceae bacterium]|nr:glucose-6-phosphate isomerase [Paracoccaceae bacterium]